MANTRKKLIIIAVILSALLLLFSLGGFLYVSRKSQGAGVIGISAADAEQIALEKAGIDKKDAYLFECELDLDGDGSKYEVEFYSNGQKHQFDISAKDGSILSYDTSVSDIYL